MVCTKPAPDPGTRGLVPLDSLEELDTALYNLQHITTLLGLFAGQSGTRRFTDGLPLETFAVVFGWLGDALHDARLHIDEINKALGEKSC